MNRGVRQMLRTDQLQISCRTQKWCHHHVLSAAERPSAVIISSFPGWESLKLGTLSNTDKVDLI
jgi:hypothetical protein